MRFPFTFMALLALAVAVWALAYLGTSRLTDPLARGLTLVAVAIFAGLAVYQLYHLAGARRSHSVRGRPGATSPPGSEG